jgi:nucleoside-diphosphate-sugar epimerase
MVDVVDNLCNTKREHAQRLCDEYGRRLTFFKQSVGEFDTINKYHTIYHLASPVGPAGVLKYAGTMGKMIIRDAVKMAQLALELDVPLFAVSTSEVYGCDPGDVPQKEVIDKIVPAKTTVRLEYGVAKLLTEISLFNLHAAEGLKVAMIRPYNTVGPGQNGEAGFVLPRFVHAALTEQAITIFGNGQQKRTFTSVNDLVNAIFAVLRAEKWGQVYNVGNPTNLYSILELAHLVKEVTHSHSEIQYTDPKELYGKLYEEAWNKIPDISKIQDETGWVPKDSLLTIINEAVMAARANL